RAALVHRRVLTTLAARDRESAQYLQAAFAPSLQPGSHRYPAAPGQRQPGGYHRRTDPDQGPAAAQTAPGRRSFQSRARTVRTRPVRQFQYRSLNEGITAMHAHDDETDLDLLRT